MQKKLYILRHGETDYNQNFIVQGRNIDSDLNEKGLAQANAFFDHYQFMKFDRVYTSSLKRTWQTVDKFIQKGIPWIKLDGLDEMNYGIFEGKKIVADGVNFFTHIRDKWFEGDHTAKAEGGESPLDVIARQKIAFNEILSHENSNDVLIAMHGRALRILLTWTLNISFTEVEEFALPNTGLYVLIYDYDQKKYLLETNASVVHLEKANSIN